MHDETRGKRLIATFLLAVVVLNYPLLAVVEASAPVFGLPPVFLYLFGAWALLIAVLAILVERRS